MINKSTQKFLFGLSLFVFLLILSIFSYQYLTFENLVEYKDEIKEFSLQNIYLTLFLFSFLAILLNNVPVPFSAISKIFSGFIFGLYMGIFVNILVTFTSAMAGFYMSRYLFKDFFQRKFKNHLETINKEIEKYGFDYFLSLRIFLAFPYFIINIFGGISKISQRKYALSSFLGVIPASILYAYTGVQIDTISSPMDLLSLDIIIIFLILASIPFIHALIKHKYIQKKLSKLKTIFNNH